MTTLFTMLFFAADVWLIVAGFWFGWQFLRRYRNYLLGIEWIVVGISAANFLVGSLFGGADDNGYLQTSYFLDAFSRSFGFTIMLILGLLAVTHGFKPSLAQDLPIILGTAVAAYVLGPFHDGTLHVGVASFYLVMNLLTTVFLAYFAWRVWQVGARRLAIATASITAAAAFIALTYDFFPLPFDDSYRTIFYTLALATWGAQGAVYFYAYRALHDARAATVIGSTTTRKAAHA